MISIENLTKGFGGQLLFEKANLKINAKERVGLVGRNGHGKTTFLRLITGEDYYDEGQIVIPKNYNIGYIKQHLEFTQDTVLKEGMKGLREDEKDNFWKVEKILEGLGFLSSDFNRSPNEFSGGYQVRLNLAKVLVSEPDLLLLDEPSNYLDITSVRWIEKFLNNWPHELILITHDRGFMDKVVTHIAGIHRKKFRKITGNTEKFYNQIAKDEEIYEKTRLNDEKKRKEVELFITRFRAKARLANMVQSRVKTLSKMGKHEKLEAVKTLDFNFNTKPFNGKQVLEAKNINFAYSPDIPLIKSFNLNVCPQDRICIIGQNGKGKTTLLKLLAGTLNPNQGSIQYNPNIEKGFYEQTNIQTLDNEKTIEQELCYSHSQVDRQQVRNICGVMMFEGNAALKKIGVLSGGEKSRVMLAKLVVTSLNLLLLDEPTNHLDMEACDSMLAALDDFKGTVIMVTHNEMFLHAIAKRLVVFKNNEIELFEGTYQEFLDKDGWEEKEREEQNNKTENKNNININDKPNSKLNKKELRKLRSEIITQKSKALKPIEKNIEKLEKNIESYEKNIEKLNNDIQDALKLKDGKKISEISKDISKNNNTIDKLFEELEQLMSMMEKKEAFFNEQLGQLEVL